MAWWRRIAKDRVVPLAGLEPARCRHQQILSLPRLPIPPQGQGGGSYLPLAGGQRPHYMAACAPPARLRMPGHRHGARWAEAIVMMTETWTTLTRTRPIAAAAIAVAESDAVMRIAERPTISAKTPKVMSRIKVT